MVTLMDAWLVLISDEFCFSLVTVALVVPRSVVDEVIAVFVLWIQVEEVAVFYDEPRWRT